MYIYGYKNKEDFPKATQAMYSGARQRAENRLSRVLMTKYPLIKVIRIPNAKLHFEFKHPSTPQHSRLELGTLPELQVKLKSL